MKRGTLRAMFTLGGRQNKFSKTKSQLKNTDQIKTNLIKDTLVEKKKTKINITSFKDLIALAFKEKEIDGILGGDILEEIKAKINYENLSIDFL